MNERLLKMNSTAHTASGVGGCLNETMSPTLLTSFIALTLLLATAQSAAAIQTAPSAEIVTGSATEVTVTWQPASVPQGTLFRVTVTPDAGSVDQVTGVFADERLHFEPGLDGSLVALAAAPIDTRGEEDLRLEVRAGEGGSETMVLPVPIVEGDYRMQELTVAPEFGRPQPAEIQERINEESARAMSVARRSHDTPRMWEPPFVAPRESQITSGFGHGRIFNEQVTSRHMGTDFRGAVGAPIRAPARGVVALVDAFYLGGNVLYLDHGGGLVTGYLHLSEHEVEEGEIVEPGQVIARVGATGRVTGPHLHWLVRYGTITVDGMSLLELE